LTIPESFLYWATVSQYKKTVSYNSLRTTQITNRVPKNCWN